MRTVSVSIKATEKGTRTSNISTLYMRYDYGVFQILLPVDVVEEEPQ